MSLYIIFYVYIVMVNPCNKPGCLVNHQPVSREIKASEICETYEDIEEIISKYKPKSYKVYEFNGEFKLVKDSSLK